MVQHPDGKHGMIKRITGAIIAAVVGSALTMSASAEAPFSFDTAPGRLPKSVVPLSYVVAIVPDIDALTLAGAESVTLQFRGASSIIVFNSLNQTLSDVRLDHRPVATVVSSNEQQLTTVTLAEPAAAGRHTLTFSYTGKIETQPHGLFAQSYVRPGGGQGRLLSTKMESTDARRMFPCWDEPAFRSTYQLTVTTPSGWEAVSNMPIARHVVDGMVATTTFQRSPSMPSYLIEFSAGELSEITGHSDGIKLSVWAARGREQEGKIALANARQILADYDDYFGYRYPLPKLDSIAVPGGFGGAMENWGAITYNDQLLLLSPSSTLANRQAVFSVQAHEMAHQWNGDLVTMGWWDDLWLNESFASWRAAKETDQRNPSWKWWQVQDADKESAMSADARLSSHAIQQHVTDELQAANAFDPEITYSKGQAVLRMFEAYLGADAFRGGVRRYIKARAYSNATTADLWNALSAASGTDIGDIASGWTEQPGFPLITVASSCNAAGERTIVLSQRRFLLRGADAAAAHWSVPLQIRSGTNGASRSVLLTRDGQTALAGRCDEPLSVNADAIGFYRARYDAATDKANAVNFTGLHDGDKIALLDDQWALVESGAEDLRGYLALASTMGSDLDTRAWEQIVEALGTIEYAERGTAGHDAFAAYARSVIKPVSGRLGWDTQPGETPDAQELRRLLIGDLGAWGEQDVIDEARRRFSAFVSDRGAIRPDDQPVILSIVARNADAETFERLHAIAKQAKNETEQQRYYLALMDVRDPQLASQAAQIALSPELPPQAARWRLRLVVRLASQHHELSWSTFTSNAETLLSPNPKYAPLITAQYVPVYFWDSVPLDQLESWVRAHVPEQMSPNVARGMETARFKLSEKQALVPAADAYVSSQLPHPQPSAAQ
jgi:aminopeptidase N